MSRFFDAVAVGDGEELFPEILTVMAEAKREGASRAETKDRLSRLDGVFVPGVSPGVTRRVVARLEGAPYPAACLVPLTAGVHDRAWVEVMRGCTRGCRFCQAGMWYRPVRERPADEVLAHGWGAAGGHRASGTGLRLALHHRLLVSAGSAGRRGASAPRGAASPCRRCGWTAPRCGWPSWRRPPAPR